MKSETFVTGGVLRKAKPVVSARVRRYASRLPGQGLLVAQIERTDGGLRVIRAEAFPRTAFDVRADLELYLNGEHLRV